MTRRIVAWGAIGALGLLALSAGGAYWFLTGDGVRRELEREATAWAGYPVRIGAASVALLPHPSLLLRDVSLGEPARVTVASIELTVPFGALLSRRIENGSVIVSGSRVETPFPFPLGAGGERPPAATTNGGIRVLSLRDIAVRDIAIVSRGREIVVAADLSLNGPRLDINRFTATTGVMALEAGGYADLEPRVNITVEATADTVDVDEVLALVSALAGQPEGRPDLPGHSTRMFARISAPRARAAGVSPLM